MIITFCIQYKNVVLKIKLLSSESDDDDDEVIKYIVSKISIYFYQKLQMLFKYYLTIKHMFHLLLHSYVLITVISIYATSELFKCNIGAIVQVDGNPYKFSNDFN